MSTGRFRLTPLTHSQPLQLVPTADTGSLYTTFQVSLSQAPAAPTPGSFAHDKASSKYDQHWKDWAHFQAWIAQEQQNKCVELRLVNTYLGLPVFERSLRYVCSRAGTGGVKQYTKLHPEWKRKIPPKRTGCPCTLLVKQYPGIPTILGHYSNSHNHAIGSENLRFTRIPTETREYIAGLVRLRVASDHILQMLHRGAYDNERTSATPMPSRTDFIQLRDIRRIEKEIEAEKVRLHPDDGLSTLRWVESLRAKGHLLGFKSKTDPPPAGSNLDRDVFTVMIQTEWQREMFREYGEALVCIDATHNVTMYENLNLTTLVVRDKWAHGIPVAWMLASSGTEETISFFLRLNRLRSPLIIPRFFLSDFDWAQINACLREYGMIRLCPTHLAKILLCWWHVLHAWQQHFRVSAHPELWDLLKMWIRLTDLSEFNITWSRIQAIAPPAFVMYLDKYWISDKVVQMWSAVYRADRSIFEACDTNMLIEAWHHVLKGKFLQGKRNRRIDHLLNTLTGPVLSYYALKQRRQAHGFEGPDIVATKRQDVLERSKVYKKDDILDLEEDFKYLVPSSTDPAKLYEVDMDSYTCTCLDFPLISFCKHICAVQELFEENDPPDGAQTPPQVPSLPALVQQPQDSSPVSEIAPKRVGTELVEKLDRLAARLRQPRKINFPSLTVLEAALDTALLETDNGTVLPSSQRIEPNTKSAWKATAAAMMPGIKTRRKAAGETPYSAGKQSGAKADKSKKSSNPVVTPSQASAQPHLPYTHTPFALPAVPTTMYPSMTQLPHPGYPQPPHPGYLQPPHPGHPQYYIYPSIDAVGPSAPPMYRYPPVYYDTPRP